MTTKRKPGIPIDPDLSTYITHVNLDPLDLNVMIDLVKWAIDLIRTTNPSTHLKGKIADLRRVLKILKASRKQFIDGLRPYKI